ncbi:DUF3298 domain-containing protein [Pseudoluteimonas lycopersici]|uniref:DUF3298 domain-containing protein n=1 Tax=Pseudoluteimonas lycopersici TaxID=1324796 RepID=A0A516V3E9_9GAMM|nr:RsiV family protein [Lysobacter lycopersici]QDQ73034.1 DUF3298 domain-containing protein [Lysobacter lycopersici]
MRSKHAAWLLLALAACNRSPQPQAQAPATATAQPPVPAASPVDLSDISERDPHYLVGISFPPELKRHPALAAEVKRDADATRAEFMQQVAANKDYQGPGPFELSLMYSMVAETPRIVAVAAEGTSFVGGAHGAPLLDRYVWLLPDNRRLTAAELVPDPAGWQAISGYVRDRLMAVQRQRFDEDAKADGGDDGDDGQPEDAALKEQLKNAADMIEQGTEPKPENFANFEPVLGADGKIAALRFVFPPYQVGPYSDGTQTIEVPAAVLLPHIAPAERGLFAGG